MDFRERCCIRIHLSLAVGLLGRGWAGSGSTRSSKLDDVFVMVLVFFLWWMSGSNRSNV